jgi:NAD(P)-dependent dehydrogenase (short-subunit alcohol dehydrogenase family)
LPFFAAVEEAVAFRPETLRFVLSAMPEGHVFLVLIAGMAEPEEVAYATLFLAGGFANMITGHVLTVDGGWTIR